jgi:hypothetical protein
MNLDKLVSKENTQKIEIKEGVDFIFEQNPKLAEIGTKEQYSKYLESIFPESKIKEILYHGTNEKLEIEKSGFDFSKIKRSNVGLGYSFFYKKNSAYEYGSSVVPVLINLKEYLSDIDAGYNFLSFTEEQVLILNTYFRNELKDSNFDIKNEKITMSNLLDHFLNKTLNKSEEASKLINSLGIEGFVGKLLGDKVVTVTDKSNIFILGSEDDINQFKEFSAT